MKLKNTLGLAISEIIQGRCYRGHYADYNRPARIRMQFEGFDHGETTTRVQTPAKPVGNWLDHVS